MSDATPFAQWMMEAGYTAETLAVEVGRDRTRVLRWRDNKGKPDFDALAKLETLSKGRVTASSFVEAAE
ncbi:MAG: hypothetical protein AB7I42_25095 [Bradyrhizobium sp.]|uniref:hypothetical protein n=1 Tax=Bradyrhizobium sp. TaxID=376 RepID=UPI003D0DF4A5